MHILAKYFHVYMCKHATSSICVNKVAFETFIIAYFAVSQTF